MYTRMECLYDGWKGIFPTELEFVFTKLNMSGYEDLEKMNVTTCLQIPESKLAWNQFKVDQPREKSLS